MKSSSEQLDVAIVPSKLHCILLCAVHLLALVALSLSGIGIWLAAALGLAVVASLASSLRRYGLLKDTRSVKHLSFRGGQWTLGLRSGNFIPASLASEVVVLNWLVVLNFRDDSSHRYPVALFGDSTGPDQLRRLRVILRWGRLESE